jgi:nitrate reductase assembly molybdenum cofactor insertion protein NarJ
MQTLATSHQESPGAFLLCSLITAYPDDGFAESVKLVLGDEKVAKLFSDICPESWSKLKEYLSEITSDTEAIRDLRGLYVDTFEKGRTINSLYETEYGIGRSIAKGQELLKIATFYKAFGFEIGTDPQSHEMVDHLAVELEFYALLVMKMDALTADNDRDGMEIVDSARKKFLLDHLGGFTKSLLLRPGVSGNSFYFHAIHCIDALIEAECKRLGVERKLKEWQDDIINYEDEMTCGAVGCLSGNPKTKSQSINQ